MHKTDGAGCRPAVDFSEAPFLVLWELTRACQLACRHCRARAMRHRNPLELSTGESVRLIGQLSEFGSPLLVLTGGDPVQRPDLFDLIREARRAGLTVAMTPSATPSVTRSTVHRLRVAGLARLAISMDGPDAECHDSFRGVGGSFDWTLSIISWAREAGLPVQINTTVCRHNFHRFAEMAELVGELGAVLWSVFFLVPVGRARQEMQISQEEAESVLERMADLSLKAPYDVKSTAAPHFRRVLMQRFRSGSGTSGEEPRAGAGALKGLSPSLKLGSLRSYQSVNDGKGLVFISDTGDIQPSGFLPLAAGNVRSDSVVAVYRNHPLFKTLRQPSLLKGKCGACPFKAVCGGSRARAYGETGDYMAADGLCLYQPPNFKS